MPRGQVDFVTRFADGYVRLARLTADAVADDPSAALPDLLDRSDVRVLLDRMLGDEDRRYLYVAAVSTHVGWSDDREHEGRAIAAHFGLDWADVRYRVDQIHRRMEIVPCGGRYRYVSPHPLGVYLASEAWKIYPDEMKSLPAVLPSESAREAYYRRLESLASNPQTRAFARDQLRFFFRIGDFAEMHAARRWSALSEADPDAAARTLKFALIDSHPEERRSIAFGTLGVVVGTLVRIAWRETGFHDAVTALALLAEAGNGSWGDVAAGAFLRKFQVNDAATSLPYVRRLDTLDELAEQGRPAVTSLVVRALARVTYVGPYVVIPPSAHQAPEPEWSVSSGAEYVGCVTAALRRLRAIVAGRDPALVEALSDAANEVAPVLGWPEASSAGTIAFFDEVRASHPVLREPLRKQIAAVIGRSRERLSGEHLRILHRLHARFEDPSLAGRLRQHVGLQPWERDGRPDFTALAAEVLAAPETLAREWSWLTSGEAAAAWELGAALAAADGEGGLAEMLPGLPGSGRDFRVVCGYVAAQRETLGDAWYERWMLRQFGREPQPLDMLLEAAWRCGVTDGVAVHVAEVLRDGRLGHARIGQLKYGNWDATSTTALQRMVRALIDAGYAETAVSIVRRRLEHTPEDGEPWRPLAVELALDPELIRCRDVPNHHWREVAMLLIADHARRIAAAIFRAHGRDRERPDAWTLQHERAVVEVLHGCVMQDPAGVWQELVLWLWPPRRAVWFVTGFPTGVLDRMPQDEVMAWIAAVPAGEAAQRAALLARLTVAFDLADDSLAARIIAAYGRLEVAEAFFSHHVSGGGWTALSVHWENAARQLDSVVARTRLSGLRRWAHRSAAKLRQMATRERQEEEEDASVWYAR